MPVRTDEYVELVCTWEETAMLIPLSYNLGLLLLCALYGFLTRKLPDNFNESWYIFISVCTTAFLWIAFLPTYYSAFYAFHKSVLLAVAIILNVTVVMICLFVPKLYALWFLEEGDIKVTNFSSRGFDSNKTNATDVTEHGKVQPGPSAKENQAFNSDDGEAKTVARVNAGSNVDQQEDHCHVVVPDVRKNPPTSGNDMENSGGTPDETQNLGSGMAPKLKYN